MLPRIAHVYGGASPAGVGVSACRVSHVLPQAFPSCDGARGRVCVACEPMGWVS